MKYLLLALGLSVSVYANNQIQGTISGCATATSFMNLQGDKTKVYNACKKCATDVPMMHVDKTSELIEQIANGCVAEYFEERNKRK